MPEHDDLFRDYCARIDRAYRELGHCLGWRFLTCPRSNLSPSTRVALISPNPGGNRDRPDHGRESCETGPAFLVEQWNSKTQEQVILLFRELSRVLGVSTHDDQLLRESLTAYFVPFRSPDLARLVNKRASLEFAEILWRDVFRTIDPHIVIALEKEVATRLSKIIFEKHRIFPGRESLSVGWGEYCADVHTFDSGLTRRVLIRFPNLGRFSIFGRPESQEPIEDILARCRQRDKN
jgi:hypothetical protein